MESKYKFEDFKDGFNIYAEGRKTCHVIFNGSSFACVSENTGFDDSAFIFGMFQYSKLMEAITGTLMRDWLPPVEKRRPNNRPSYKIGKWARSKTAKALGKRVNARRIALISKADPRYVQAQRNYYAACANFHRSLTNKALYKEENKFILSDICKYRAAALTMSDMRFTMDGNLNGWYTSCLHSVDNWMQVYSYDDKPSGPLRKTLMNLPGGIPYLLLKNLKFRDIERPYLSRLELLAYLAAVDFYRDGSRIEENVKVINRSSPEQISKALRIVHAHLRQKESLRKTTTIISNIRYIFDYEDKHNGSIAGMAEKSIKWHRCALYQLQMSRCTLPGDTATKLPPIDLPNNKGIRFLDTIKSIFDESAEMYHCVGSYAISAVNGQCYLFHIDYRNTSATIEVSPKGRVVQSRGPSNCRNAATKWGEKMLSKWAKPFALTEHAGIIDDIPF